MRGTLAEGFITRCQSPMRSGVFASWTSPSLLEILVAPTDGLSSAVPSVTRAKHATSEVA